MDYKAKDILDIQAIQELMDSFSSATNIPTAILDLDGNILTGSGWQKICLEFHRKNNHAKEACLKSDTHFNNELGCGKPYVLYECPHGLIDAAAPVIVGDVHIANIFTGQFLMHKRDEAVIERFKNLAQKYGFNEKAYLAAMHEIPVFNKDKVQKILKFLVNLASFIGESGLNNLKLKQSSNKLEERIKVTDERYQRLVEGSPDIFYSFSNKDGGFYVSNRVTEVLGYDPNYLRENSFIWYNSIQFILMTSTL